MSHRPLTDKAHKRNVKKLRSQLPAYFDLIQWMLDHDHASTKREARTLILARKVKSASHPLGIATVPALVNGIAVMQEIVDPRIPIAAKQDIIVSS